MMDDNATVNMTLPNFSVVIALPCIKQRVGMILPNNCKLFSFFVFDFVHSLKKCLICISCKSWKLITLLISYFGHSKWWRFGFWPPGGKTEDIQHNCNFALDILPAYTLAKTLQRDSEHGPNCNCIITVMHCGDAAWVGQKWYSWTFSPLVHM